MKASLQQEQAGGSASSEPAFARYSYQESERPEVFFVPCVWAAAVRTAPEIPWRLADVALFNPFAAGFLRWSGRQDDGRPADGKGDGAGGSQV